MFQSQWLCMWSKLVDLNWECVDLQWDPCSGYWYIERIKRKKKSYKDFVKVVGKIRRILRTKQNETHSWKHKSCHCHWVPLFGANPFILKPLGPKFTEFSQFLQLSHVRLLQSIYPRSDPVRRQVLSSVHKAEWSMTFRQFFLISRNLNCMFPCVTFKCFQKGPWWLSTCLAHIEGLIKCIVYSCNPSVASLPAPTWFFYTRYKISETPHIAPHHQKLGPLASWLRNT